MTSPDDAQVARPLWWLAWVVFVAAGGMLAWLYWMPLATTSDLPGQVPLHDVSGR